MSERDAGHCGPDSVEAPTSGPTTPPAAADPASDPARPPCDCPGPDRYVRHEDGTWWPDDPCLVGSGTGEPPGFLGHYLTLHTSDPVASESTAKPLAWSRMAGETITHVAMWDAPTGGQLVNVVREILRGILTRVASADDLLRIRAERRRMHQQYRARQVARRRRGRRS